MLGPPSFFFLSPHSLYIGVGFLYEQKTDVGFSEFGRRKKVGSPRLAGSRHSIHSKYDNEFRSDRQ